MGTEQQISIAGRGPGEILKKISSINQSAHELIEKLTAGNFYGNVELTFTGGKVTLIKQVKTIKL